MVILPTVWRVASSKSATLCCVPNVSCKTDASCHFFSIFFQSAIGTFQVYTLATFDNNMTHRFAFLQLIKKRGHVTFFRSPGLSMLPISWTLTTSLFFDHPCYAIEVMAFHVPYCNHINFAPGVHQGQSFCLRGGGGGAAIRQRPLLLLPCVDAAAAAASFFVCYSYFFPEFLDWERIWKAVVELSSSFSSMSEIGKENGGKVILNARDDLAAFSTII